jgi:hypothetical protein
MNVEKAIPKGWHDYRDDIIIAEMNVEKAIPKGWHDYRDDMIIGMTWL